MIAPAAWARLKAGIIAAISICGGVDGAAATVSKSRTLTGTWRNQNDDAMPRVDHAFALDQVAVLQGQRPAILSAYAADLGFTIIAVPDDGSEGECLLGALIDAVAEHGDIAAEVHEARRDGRICGKDRGAIVRQIDEAMQSLARLRAAADREQ